VIKPFRIMDWWLARRRRRTPRAGAANGVLVISSGGLGDTVLFAHVAERFIALARKAEPVTVLLRADAMKMAFLLPPAAAVIGVDFKRLGRDLGYRRQVTDDIFRAHYRLVVHTDYLRHPDLDEALVAAAMAPEAAAMEPRPWAKYDAALSRNRGLYTRLYDSGGRHVDKVLRWAAFADWLAGKPSPPPKAVLSPDRLAAPAGERTVVMQPFSAVRQKQSPPALYRRLIAVRKAEPALTEGIQTHVRRQASLLFFRREFQDRRLLVVLNTSGDDQQLNFSELGSKAHVLLSTSPDRQDEACAHEVRLRGHEGLILVLE